MAEIKGVMLYFNYREPLNNLSMSERGELLTALLDYGKDGIIPDFSGGLKMLFDCIKPTIDSDIEKYIEKCGKYRDNRIKGLSNNDNDGQQSITTDNDGQQSSLNKIKENKINKNKIKENNNLLFVQFWDKYPKKKGKQSAEKAFQKIAPDEALFKTMLNAIEEQKKSAEWQKDNGQYIPHPATWLNGRRWEDEIKVDVCEEQTEEFIIGENF